MQAWLEKKRAAIESVEADYIKIFDLAPVPPPSWIVASASRVGLMWAGLDLAITRVPMPAGWSLQTRATHLAALDAMREPIKARRAKPAMIKCMELGVKLQLTDEHTRACEAWLAKSYKAEFRRVDEAIPALRAGPRERPPPVDRDGVPRRD